MTSVGTAAAGGWVDAPGETVGPLAGQNTYNDYPNPTRVYMTVIGYYNACGDAAWATLWRPSDKASTKFKDVRYMQFVTDYYGALGGLCYYYEAGSSSGESGPYTWRFD